MEKVKKIVLWLLVVFFLLVTIAFMPSLSSFVALTIAIVIAPIQKWQDILGKFIKGKIKVIISAILVVVMFVTAPVTPTEEAGDKTESTPAPITTAVVGTENTTVAEAVITTESNVTDTTEDTKLDTTETATSTEVIVTTESAVVTLPVVVDTTSAHVHSFAAATCTTPKTCTSCGTTEGSALGHNYSNGSCTRCGENDPNYVAEDMVWISGNGSKYHSNPNCSGMKNPSQVSKSQAEASGRGPCSKCY